MKHIMSSCMNEIKFNNTIYYIIEQFLKHNDHLIYCIKKVNRVDTFNYLKHYKNGKRTYFTQVTRL